MIDAQRPNAKNTYLKQAMSFFRNVRRYLIYGDGDRKVTALQQQLLDNFLPTLAPDVRAVVNMQLVQPFKISFYNGGRINPFYFKEPKLTPELLLCDPAFADRLYKVEMFVDGRKEHAHVTFFENRIFSLEFKKPFKFYEGKDIRFGAVTLGKPKQSFTEAIDRQEHGKDGHHATGEE